MLLYGYRVDGPYEPAAGHRFNARKLLLDPYAKAIAGAIEWSDAIFGYRVGDPDADLTRDDRDSAPFVPKSVVVDSAFTWGDDRPLRTPWHLTVIYEVHVKGFTARNPAVPKALRGTYAGLASPASIEYLPRLGVTAVELMPVHHFVRDRHLADRGLTNYWGYNTIGFFAPDSRYASEGVRGEQVREFKQMVKALHQAGIEVILDVVYNHTAEGNHLGPTLCFRGIDNAAYYRLVAEDRRHYMDYTGMRQHARHDAPPVRAAPDGQPPVLGVGDARRRLPLRPGLRSGAGAPRGRPPLVLLRRDPPGPADQPGQAHRRALGPGGRRLPGGQLPGRLGRVERPLPGHDPPVLEGGRRPGGGPRLSPRRDPATSTSREAAGRRPASTS